MDALVAAYGAYGLGLALWFVILAAFIASIVLLCWNPQRDTFGADVVVQTVQRHRAPRSPLTLPEVPAWVRTVASVVEECVA